MTYQKFTSIPPKKLSQSILSTATDFKLNDIAGWDGTNLTSASFGTVAFGAFINANRTIVEFFSFDPSTIASASITFVDRGLMFTGDNTSVPANKLDWSAGDTTVQLGADVPQLLTLLMDLGSAQTITAVKTFTSTAKAKYDAEPTFVYGNHEIVTWDKAKDYIDGIAIAGAPNMDTTTKGIGEEATQAEIDAGTQTGGTGAELVVNPKYLKDSIYKTQLPSSGEKSALGGTSGTPSGGNPYATKETTDVKVSQSGAEIYATSTTGNDTYVVTLSPVPSSYTNGMRVYFKPDTSNTGAATLNVNSLGAKTIKKNVSQDLETGEIVASQIVEVVYDGTNFQLVSIPYGTRPNKIIYSSANTSTSSTTGETTIITGTIFGGTLGTNGIMKGRIYVDHLFYSGTPTNLTIRYKYGSTTIVTDTFALNSADSTGYIDFYLISNGATNTQSLVVTNTLGTITAKETTKLSGTSTEDSTTNLSFIVTMELSSSNGTYAVKERFIEVS